MYAVTGITGQVGGAVARTLLAGKQPVRAVLRNAAKGEAWAARGCEVALADINDAKALTAAFSRVQGVFVLLPPTFDPSPGFPEARAEIEALRAALKTAAPARVVCLSTIGAQSTRTSLLTQLSILEQALGALNFDVAFLRAGWFMENFAWDVEPARDEGVLPSFLQPLDRKVPMVATEDVGRVAAELLQERGGAPVLELEGPRRLCPNEVAQTFSEVLGRPVRAEVIPRDRWEELFKAQGMKRPEPRIEMLDGFNQGWIDFEGGEAHTCKGKVEIKTVLRGLVGANARA
jgi:uncharacterized protein YbjT (DUF2867 family)